VHITGCRIISYSHSSVTALYFLYRRSPPSTEKSYHF